MGYGGLHSGDGKFFAGLRLADGVGEAVDLGGLSLILAALLVMMSVIFRTCWARPNRGRRMICLKLHAKAVQIPVAFEMHSEREL